MLDDTSLWSSLHKQLQDIMKEELKMLREVFSIMKEEEEALLHKDFLSKKTIGSKRCLLNKQLKSLQRERSYLTKALVKTSNQALYVHHFNSKNFNLLISQDEDNAVETFHLRDQILYLMKNIKQLKERITILVRAGEHTSLDSLSPGVIPLPIEAPQQKKKPLAKTIQTMNSEESLPESSSSC
jgi:hypothetical protein